MSDRALLWFYDDPDGARIHEIESATVPRIGETVWLSDPHSKNFLVVDIDYLYPVPGSKAYIEGSRRPIVRLYGSLWGYSEVRVNEFEMRKRLLPDADLKIDHPLYATPCTCGHIHGRHRYLRENRDGVLVANCRDCDCKGFVWDRRESPVEQLKEAVRNEGRNPDHHRSVMARHMKEWPTLWSAIERILEET